MKKKKKCINGLKNFELFEFDRGEETCFEKNGFKVRNTKVKNQ